MDKSKAYPNIWVLLRLFANQLNNDYLISTLFLRYLFSHISFLTRVSYSPWHTDFTYLEYFCFLPSFIPKSIVIFNPTQVEQEVSKIKEEMLMTVFLLPISRVSFFISQFLPRKGIISWFILTRYRHLLLVPDLSSVFMKFDWIGFLEIQDYSELNLASQNFIRKFNSYN